MASVATGRRWECFVSDWSDFGRSEKRGEGLTVRRALVAKRAEASIRDMNTKRAGGSRNVDARVKTNSTPSRFNSSQTALLLRSNSSQLHRTRFEALERSNSTNSHTFPSGPPATLPRRIAASAMNFMTGNDSKSDPLDLDNVPQLLLPFYEFRSSFQRKTDSTDPHEARGHHHLLYALSHTAPCSRANPPCCSFD